MSHTHAGAIQVAKAAASVVAAQDFNGAVVNVYDTPTAQIKWHDDGEYWYKCRHMYTRTCTRAHTQHTHTQEHPLPPSPTTPPSSESGSSYFYPPICNCAGGTVVGSLNFRVSFANEPYKHGALFEKRPA